MRTLPNDRHNSREIFVSIQAMNMPLLSIRPLKIGNGLPPFPLKPRRGWGTERLDFRAERIIRLLAVGLAGLLVNFGAVAQSADFTINQSGQPIGTASFSFTSKPGGYDSTSVVRIAMQGLDYALSKTEKLSPDNHLQHVLLSGVVNGAAVTVTGAPDTAQILLNFSAGGHSTTTRLPAHPAAIFLADFDPGALETLLALAATQGNRDLWAILPKQNGSVEPVSMATYADEQGTLDGKSVLVHHQIATIAGTSTDLFSGPENQLLQAELPQQGFVLVRKGFVLTPPAKPVATSSDD